MLRILFFCLAFIHFNSIGRAAEFYSVQSDGATTILLWGPITSGDFDRFQEVLDRSISSGVHVRRLHLASVGGDVDEALKIGRLVREYGIFTSAPQLHRKYVYGDRVIRKTYRMCGGRLQGRAPMVSHADGLDYVEGAEVEPACICASACSLIWFAGLQRNGQVGVHRSYFSQVPPDVDFKTYSEALEGSHSDIGAYLSEMRAPSAVFEQMKNTSSEDLYFFETKNYEFEIDKTVPPPIPSIDSVYDEFVRARCPRALSDAEAKEYGKLSMIERLGYYLDIDRDLERIPSKMTKEGMATLEEYRRRDEAETNCREKTADDMQRSSQGLIPG